MDSLLDHDGPLLHWEEDAGGTGPGWGLEIDISFCPEPQCRTAHIQIAGVASPGRDDGPTPRIQVSIHVDSGVVEIDPAPDAGSPEATVAERFTGLMQRPGNGFLERACKRFRRARGESYEGWRLEDWSEWDPGQLVFFERIFPDAPDFLFESNGEQFWAHDGYCINPDCTCQDVALVFFKTERKANGEPNRPLCNVSVNVDHGKITRADNAADKPPSKQQERLWGDLRASEPDLGAQLK